MFTRLYIHIPYCRRKCPYCSFFSEEHSNGDLSGYSDLLLREMSLAAELSAPQKKLDSIYFGGGTPSLLEPQQISGLIRQAEMLFGVDELAEITLETNPGTVDAQKLEGFRQTGVNRLSLGIQSFDDRMLRVLGRIHSAEQAREAFASARRVGFGNIGLDLIHSLPGQTAAMWLAELRQALQLAPDHLSIYGLTIEEGTPFDACYDSDSPLLPGEDLSAEMFEAADELLEANGYGHYEIANYAHPGCRSRHNSGYWKRDGYLGIGAGAHSFLRDTGYGTRFSTVADLKEYAEALSGGALPRRDILELTRADAMSEVMFLGLRMSDGVSFCSFEQEFGVTLKSSFEKAITSMIKLELLAENSTGIRLTRRGRLLSNQVFQQFLPERPYS